MTAIKLANKAAETAFDRYLKDHRSTATMHIPQCVIDAATAAYREAGGKKQIEVRGHGNTTHPVCSVEVRVKAR